MPPAYDNLVTAKAPKCASTKHFSEYILQDLVQDHGYNSVTSYSAVNDLIGSLTLPAPRAQALTIIGVNGPTCAGKTTFTELLASSLAARGVPATRIGLDWFLYDRERRSKLVEDIAQGRKAIPEVTKTAWDVQRYTTLLRQFKAMHEAQGSTQSPLRLNRLYDRTRGTQTAVEEIGIPYGGYIIVEGVGILDTDGVDLIDYHVRLDVNDDEILINRAVARERLKPPTKRLSEEFLRNRFGIMDLHHMRYTRMISYDHNHHIIDASDFNQIKVFSKSHA